MADTATATTLNSDAGGTTVQPGAASTGGPSGVQGGGNANSAANGTANGSTDWTAALPESTKLYVQNKGFKDPTAVLESYQNLEKLVGVPKERLLKLPDKSDAPEWNDIYDRLGRPKEASEYKFAAPEGAEVNKEFTSWAQKQFHELGLTKTQGEKLAAKWNEYALGDLKAQSEARAAAVKTESDALRREWGAAYEQNLKAAERAALSFGLGKDEVTKLEQSLGYSATLKFLQQIGAKVGEGSFVEGDQKSNGFKGALTPAAAQAEIDALKKDADFCRRYASGDREAFQKMETLHKFLHPDLPQN